MKIQTKRMIFPFFLSLVSASIGILGSQVLYHEGNPVEAFESVLSGETQEVANASPGVLTNASNIFVALSKKVVPSVVNISTFSNMKIIPRMRGGSQDPFRQFFEDFFGRMPNQPYSGGKRAQSLGTGFIIDDSGLILTNHHVVSGADDIEILFTEDSNEKPAKGEVIGMDPELDLALIQVKTERKLKALPLGDSQKLQVGEYVMAVGNPFGRGHTVTHGIISATGREIEGLAISKYLQTDAPINPGNSGGPLVNLQGELIGINNAIDARGQGIGFAIPVNSVKAVLDQLKTKGKVARGYIGVSIGELSPELAAQLQIDEDEKGPLVSGVEPGEAADEAGVMPYDVVVEFNGVRVRKSTDLIKEVTRVPVGKKVSMEVIREGEKKSLQIKVGERPSAQTMASRSPRKADRVLTGMSIETARPELNERYGHPVKARGVIVTYLKYGGPAARSGLQVGDLIVEVNRKPVKSEADFNEKVSKKETYLLRVRSQSSEDRSVYQIIPLNLKDE
ncbi:MAG: hypothetical protein CL678_11400 [Bdellovibrionaceae bacterium]|nr:hypothetical protein [Pseudobdellovibrionaceae bacterium]|tara:strand:+ start:1590 stop:3113 length:1524 start_codon:yes stop_codon:yes gene_type:complete